MAATGVATAVHSPARARSLRRKMLISLAIVFGLGCLATLSALYSLSRVADMLKLIELSVGQLAPAPGGAAGRAAGHAAGSVSGLSRPAGR